MPCTTRVHILMFTEHLLNRCQGHCKSWDHYHLEKTGVWLHHYPNVHWDGDHMKSSNLGFQTRKYLFWNFDFFMNLASNKMLVNEISWSISRFESWREQWKKNHFGESDRSRTPGQLMTFTDILQFDLAWYLLEEFAKHIKEKTEECKQ